jgi:hypothetical protein
MMNESEVKPAENEVDNSSSAQDRSHDRVVIDFTVGPAGVGPATSITPTGDREVDVEPTLAE